VIVDTAIMERRVLSDAAKSFAELNAYFIGVKPPLEVCERWEAQRGDRPKGQARKHYDLVHAHGQYDLLCDPGTMTPEQCAKSIIEMIDSKPPKAFFDLVKSTFSPS
jgi:chloramphenicol 3-O phosphotransferase